MRFTNRKKQILQEVVIKFIQEAEPISSAKIATDLDLDISPATIRKEMNDLEEMGYLTHPHTSAGRIPTDMGYRFYVDNITGKELNPLVPGDEDMPDIRKVISKSMGIENILKQSAEMLAKITNYLSMIVAPSIYQSRFKHLELLKLEGVDHLMILITDTGRVYKRNFRLEGDFNDLDLQSAAGVLNTKLRDKSIMDIETVDIQGNSPDANLVLLVNRILYLVKSCMEENVLYNRIFVHGTSVIMKQPEFIDIENIHQIINLVENEYLLMNMLMDFSEDKIFMVKIGEELFSEGLNNLSLVASKYRIKENASGTIGILGPRRMDYSRVMNILDIFRNNLSDIFDSGTGPACQVMEYERRVISGAGDQNATGKK
ncbi:MAG TPA: heat-inducible transcription repressor HrcA [Actinobacteria bacterium]|nr:heat-inducible transcription repressor HrcA [Actinomycetota bacterium]